MVELFTALATLLTFSAAAPSDVARAFHPSTRSVQAAPAGNADTGKQIYVKYGCYQCHGRAGQGSPSTGPRLGPDPMPFAAFARYVRRPPGDMPPYTAKVMTDQDLADVHAFLRSLPRPAPSGTLPGAP